ncbi:MAG: ABC transporter substrate-binding protein [Candidatus Omnitrophota bacterium]|jgi:ABC-type branched-subunit amino acid transport system substrate-binding protein
MQKKGLLITAVLFSFFFSVMTPVQAQDTTPAKEKVVISINLAFTGPYKDQSEEQLKAYQLAIETINAQGGILGKSIVAEVNDSFTKATLAADNAKKAIEEKGAVMIIGGCSSSEAVALADLAQEKKVIFLPGVTNSNAITGFDIDAKTGQTTRQVANRYTFRWFNNAWMTARALSKYLTVKLGTQAKYYYIVADYTWGHSIEKSMRQALESAGSTTLEAVRVPMGTENFSQYLLKVKEAKPDALILGLYGKDMINCLKQATAFGIKENIKIIVPVIESNMAKSTGPESLKGIIGSIPWYWSLKDTYKGSKELYDKFTSKYGLTPCANSAVAWTTLLEYADAVKRAGTFEAKAVIKALENHKFVLLKGEEYWRDWDHQGINSVIIVEGKGPGEQTNENDVFKIVDEIPGAIIAPTQEDNPVIWTEKLE